MATAISKAVASCARKTQDLFSKTYFILTVGLFGTIYGSAESLELTFSTNTTYFFEYQLYAHRESPRPHMFHLVLRSEY